MQTSAGQSIAHHTLEHCTAHQAWITPAGDRSASVSCNHIQTHGGINSRIQPKTQRQMLIKMSAPQPFLMPTEAGGTCRMPNWLVSGSVAPLYRPNPNAQRWQESTAFRGDNAGSDPYALGGRDTHQHISGGRAAVEGAISILKTSEGRLGTHTERAMAGDAAGAVRWGRCRRGRAPVSAPAPTIISLIDGAAQQSSSACCSHVAHRDSPSPEMLFTTAPPTPPRTLDDNWPTPGPDRRCHPPRRYICPGPVQHRATSSPVLVG